MRPPGARGRAQRRLPSPIDVDGLSEAASGPIDTRRWADYGRVRAPFDGRDPVQFDPDLGPLVHVELQPGLDRHWCRVASTVAGAGEGAYHPFVAGDEVLVVVPRGDEWATPAIVGRLWNASNPFPSSSVAGQDPTRNSFAFERRRTPFVAEYASTFMARIAPTGSFLLLSDRGAVTIRDGAKGALQLGADSFSYVSGDGSCILQLDLGSKRLTIKAGDALMTLSSSSASPPRSALVAPGSLAISTSGNPAAEHVATTESVLNIVVAVFTDLATKLAPIAGPLTGPALAALFAPPAFSALTVVPAIALAASGQLEQVVATALSAAFAASTQKPAGLPVTGQRSPGLGCPGFFAG